ncbi:SUMF1/EgtB/PvdO family nonheme iron enzyme [Nostoc edaphicum CCNP1411]|uniref:SUMF1/EgtB/PvdO family nonheme iron enzyme n=1 Tax=Nostoc edaphicum CCNP1411 TaxID=1472755 RepID=A0A7D7LAA0_9NOSO|nr:SUMF1/EgtB/PvdO family nonheme iron enzyme [Nostoc edaphicum CCNP1411]
MQKQLQETWQTLGLSDRDVGVIERRINAEIETYQANLRQYEQEFTEGVQQEYPLSAFKRSQLTQRHQALNLTAEDVTAIENPIIAAIEEHQQKLQQYEEVFRESIQFEYPLSDATREELKRFQQILELNDVEIAELEAIIIQSSSEAEDQKEQERIRQQQESVRLKHQEVEKQRQQDDAEKQQKLQQYIQQPSRTQLTPATQERITRQKFLKWAGLGGVGLVTAVVVREIFKGDETVTVDKKGQIIKRDPTKQAKFFKEDLGNGITLDMVQIVAGSFKMGSPPSENGRTKAEDPQHTVNVPAFFIGNFQVTQEQYQQIMGSNPSSFKGAKRPVEKVSWNDAVEFCEKLSQKTGRKYRLPSEAEWEYACRAGTTTPFHFGETITTELANYNGDYTYASAPKGKFRQETTEVGSFPPNAFGLYDMHGNVWEWCQDSWHDNYKEAPIDGSAWIDNDNKSPLLRGGSWLYDPDYCRSACRYYDTSRDFHNYDIGFRIVCAAGRIL